MLVLTGAGGVAFCAGADLKATETMAPRLMSEEGPMGFTRLTPSKPTIAAISGFCLAGGLEIALWCDLRIATEGSKLGYPERRWGVPLIDGGTQRLPRIVGLGRALDLILTGRIIDAAEALAMGLLDRGRARGRAPGARARAGRGPRALSRSARCSPTAARRSRASGCRSPTRSRSRPQAGPEVFEDGARGAARFAAGEGRGGAGAGRLTHTGLLRLR